MRSFLLTLGLILGSAAAAEGWQPLDGPRIGEALTGRVIDYDGGAWQDFRASGRTLYHAGRDSWGSWEVRGDAYCSQWPPSALWDCYGVERDGDRIRFVAGDGSVTAGTLRE